MIRFLDLVYSILSREPRFLLQCQICEKHEAVLLLLVANSGHVLLKRGLVLGPVAAISTIPPFPISFIILQVRDRFFVKFRKRFGVYPQLLCEGGILFVHKV